MKLKCCHYARLEMLYCLVTVLFFTKVKMFRFWPKTMDGVLAEIEAILCGPFTPHWKVL